MSEIKPEDMDMPDWTQVKSPAQLDPEKAAKEARENVDPDN